MLDHQTKLELEEFKLLHKEVSQIFANRGSTPFETAQIACQIIQNLRLKNIDDSINRAFGSYPSDNSKTYLELIGMALGANKEEYAQSLQIIADSLFQISEKM